LRDAFPSWLISWMESQEVRLWGAADLRGFSTLQDAAGRGFAFALSHVAPMNPQVMAGIRDGPNQAYADEYAGVNSLINERSQALADEIKGRGFRAQALAASERTDPVNIKGDFPHKTAATLAGLGWIGRHCQLITRKFGPWIRLGTVFTDMPLSCGPPIARSFCGNCTRCVDACPAGALKGKAWRPGLARDELLDAGACDRWKKENYYQFHKGHNCGICSAVCPHGFKTLKSRPKTC
jgi:epoxyqueuosine reductase